MKLILISSVLVTLSQTSAQYDAGPATPASVQKYDNTGAFINKYLTKKRSDDRVDMASAKSKAKKLQAARESEVRLNDKANMIGNFLGQEYRNDKPSLRYGYHMDPVLNDWRRKTKYATVESGSIDSNSRSSSREFKDWKREWQQIWLKKQYEANFTDPGGDRVNMVAARPWGVPCGDPSQHDMPWGTCVLPAECNAEYRIYRGDYFCGRSQFVCCSLIFHSYDTYQGLEVSLEQTSMETDSAEDRERSKKRSSAERRKKANRRRRHRMRLRRERKRKIRKTITKIVKEVRKILSKAYKNGTKMRRRKTKTMKKFIKFLKKQYKMDRNSAKDIHENQMFDIDQSLMEKLLQIKDLNHEFMTNDTFRAIIANKSMTMKVARMLVETYPELTGYVANGMMRHGAPRRGYYGRIGDVSLRREGASLRRGDMSRRRADMIRRRGDMFRRRIDALRQHARRRKYDDYDIEYGLLYS